MTALPSALAADPIIAEIAAVLRTVPTEEKVWARMSALRIGATCGRCWGSGHYSRNMYGQTHCYQCSGRTVIKPSKPAQWSAALESAKIAAADGTLDQYIAYRQVLGVAKSAQDTVMAAWSSTGVDGRYSWTEAARASNLAAKGEIVSDELREHRRIADLNGEMCNAYRRVTAMADQMTAAKDDATRRERTIALAAEVPIALAIIADAASRI